MLKITRCATNIRSFRFFPKNIHYTGILPNKTSNEIHEKNLSWMEKRVKQIVPHSGYIKADTNSFSLAMKKAQMQGKTHIIFAKLEKQPKCPLF